MMDFTHFRDLRSSLVAALVMLSVGTSSAWFALHERNAAQEKRARTLATQKASQQEYARLRDDAPILQEAAARLENLKATGRLGDERRLAWLDTLQRLGEARRLNAFKYEFSPPAPLDSAPGDGSAIGFTASRLHLRASVLHEGILMGLLKDLLQQQDALVLPLRCSLVRAGGNDGGPSRSALWAECEFDWITLHLPKPATNHP